MEKLTYKQTEIVNGSLLGDGCIHKKNRSTTENCSFVKSQSNFDKNGINKLEYIQWHFDQLQPFSSKLSFTKRNEYCYSTKSLSIFTQLEEKWYIQNRPKRRTKVIPDDLDLTPLTVAVWYIDDGSNFPKKREAKFATNCFSKRECQRLCDNLLKLGIVAHIQEFKNQFLIRVGPKSYLDFIDMIKPYCLWSCYAHKHDLSEYNSICWKKGKDHYNAKFDEKDIRNIFALKEQGQSQVKISELFGVNQGTICKILNRKLWKHLEVPNP